MACCTKGGGPMPHYERNFITLTLLRADFVRGTFPLEATPGETLTAPLSDYPLRSAARKTKNEIRIEKTPQGPVKDTRSLPFTEFSFLSADKTRRFVLCSEYAFLEVRGYIPHDEAIAELTAVIAAAKTLYPALKIARLGMRYVNDIRLPEAEAGTGLGADFWKSYVNELLLGGLRFAANDGALARQMNSIELNYGTDRATVKYGIFNAEYPKPNRRREFILDIDTFCQTPLEPEAVGAKLSDFHRAACSVFETAVTDALRRRMGAQ